MRTSVRSFRGEIQDPLRRAYVFVLERPGRQRVGGILGTSMLIAQHGTLDSPCTFFEMREREHYSSTLARHFRHQVLSLGYHFDAVIIPIGDPAGQIQFNRGIAGIETETHTLNSAEDGSM